MSKQGWTWLYNARKWHYFVESRSLCGRWMCFGTGLVDDAHDSPDNCKACLRKLKKEYPEKFTKEAEGEAE